jgi:hypothetical protein
VDTERKGIPAVASAGTRIVLISYPRHLLTLARKLIDESEFSVSVVVSHMACEIAVERSLSEAFSKSGTTAPKWLNGYSLANKKIQKIYTSLTGDEVQKKPFWPRSKKSADRRNQIVHSDHRIGKVEAEESMRAANDFVAHVEGP